MTDIKQYTRRACRCLEHCNPLSYTDCSIFPWGLRPSRKWNSPYNFGDGGLQFQPVTGACVSIRLIS